VLLSWVSVMAGLYAILGPKRLGYSAGISCHGSQMLDYIHSRTTRSLTRTVTPRATCRALNGAAYLSQPGEKLRGAQVWGFPNVCYATVWVFIVSSQILDRDIAEISR
jgi:hypothetical protein